MSLYIFLERCFLCFLYGLLNRNLHEKTKGAIIDLVVYYYFFVCEDDQKDGDIFIVDFLFVKSIFERIKKKNVYFYHWLSFFL